MQTLQDTAEREQASIERLEQDRTSKSDELVAIEADIGRLQTQLAELQAVVEDRNAKLENVRKTGSKSAKALDKALKEIAECVSERRARMPERHTEDHMSNLERRD